MSLAQYVQRKFSNVELNDTHLHDYQRKAAQFIIDNPFCAAMPDTGAGKTAITLRAISTLLMREEINRVLIIAPKRVANVTWPDEMQIWSFAAPLNHNIIRDDDLADTINRAGQRAREKAKAEGHGAEAVKAIVEEARKAAAARAVREQFASNKAHIHLIHFEQVEFLVEAWGREWPYDVVVIDESTGIKDHRTNRWKALWRVRPLMKRMIQLTATPASEGYLWLFGQITLLDMGERLGKSFTKFADRWATQNRYTRKWEMRDGAEDEISSRIADICLVLKQEDCYELQQPLFVKHRIRLGERERELYDTMESESLVEIEDDAGCIVEVEAESSGALWQKLCQLASGCLYQTVYDEIEAADGPILKPRRVVHHIHDHKIEALRQLIEEIDAPTIVCYYHQASLDRIKAAFPQAQEMDDAGKMIGLWNKGKVPILLMHPMSNAHGLNLQKGGRHMVFFDLVPSYERYYQMWRRLARQGQPGIVVIHHLLARDTIDEVIMSSLGEKKNVQEVLFELLKAKRRKLKGGS